MTGFRANSNRSGTVPAHDWRNYPQHVPTFTARLRGVVIENNAAAEIIKRHDGPSTLFYIDPPYPHESRNMNRGNAAYAVEMTDEDHERLSQQLHAVRGMVIVSGYACDLYDRLFHGWARTESHAHADGARKRIEVLWMNDACHRMQRQQSWIA